MKDWQRVLVSTAAAIAVEVIGVMVTVRMVEAFPKTTDGHLERPLDVFFVMIVTVVFGALAMTALVATIMCTRGVEK